MEKEFLYKLLYYALLEIREESSEIKNKRIFWISNLIHNLPLKLKDLETEEEFKKLAEEIKEKAKKDGMEKWFEYLVQINKTNNTQ